MALLDRIIGKFLYFVAIKVRGGSTYPIGVMILEALIVKRDCPFTGHSGTRTAPFIFIDISWFHFRPDYMEAEGFFPIINACRRLRLLIQLIRIQLLHGELYVTRNSCRYRRRYHNAFMVVHFDLQRTRYASQSISELVFPN